ncbi:MAG TPA: protein TolR [Chromatiales bacterium]|nr:protein TolR [Chromatiales bacterium]
MSNTKRARRRPMSEINVVPYIDVMLVLLIIFMVTAPLMTQGVKVDLPQATAEPVEQTEKEPLIVSIDVDGLYYLNVGEDPKKGIDHELLVQRVAAVLRYQPGTPVLVRGDAAVNYGAVVTAMALLQKAGAPSVGLVTDVLDE